MGYLSKDEYSQTKNAIGIRTAELLNDDRANKHTERTNRYRNKKRKEKVVAKAATTLSFSRDKSVRLPRVKHHLSKGRDASDIAVREGWLVSDVVKLIEMVKEEG